MRIKAGNSLAEETQVLDFGTGWALTQANGHVTVSNGALAVPAPTGVAATDTANLQALVTAINASGGGVDVPLPAGTYVVNAALGTITVSHVHFFGKGTGITSSDFSAAPSNTTWLKVAGTLGTSVALTGDTTVAGTTLTFAAGAESNFAVDDYVLIGSDDYFEARTVLYGAGTGQKLGEIAQVTSVGSGTMTLRTPLAGGFLDDSAAAKLIYKTADNAFVRKVNFVEDITFEGFSLVGTSGSGSGSQIGIEVQYGFNVTTRDVRASHIAATAVRYRSVVAGRITNCRFFDTWDSGSGYDVAIGDASQDCEVDNIYSRNSRHIFTTIGTVGTYGIARRITVSNSQAHNTIGSGDAFDTHACAEAITFENCRAFGSSGHGFNIECGVATVDGCLVHNSQNAGINLLNYTFGRTDYRIVNNRLRKTGLTSGWPGIRFRNSSATTGLLLSSFVCTGNNSVDSGDMAYDLEGNGTQQFKDWIVANNVADNPGVVNTTNTVGFYIFDSDRCVFHGNIVRRLADVSGAIGHRIRNSTRSSIMGNICSAAGATNTRGFSPESLTDSSVIGNTVDTCKWGILQDDASTNNTIMGNNLGSCTTPLTVGAGTGHVVGPNQTGTQTVNIASAATVTLPRHTDYINVTGVTTITALTADTAGRRVTLRFAGILTFTDGSNLKLAGNLTTAADTTISLISDGTNWYEVSRSVN